MFPDAGFGGQLLQRGINENAAVAALNNRRFSRRAQGCEKALTGFRFRIEPREGDKVFIKKLADRVGGPATAWSDNTQSKRAQLMQQLSAPRKRDDQLLAKARHAIQQCPELAVWNAQDSRCALRD